MPGDFDGFSVTVYRTNLPGDRWIVQVVYRNRPLANLPLADMDEDAAALVVGRLALAAARGLLGI